MKSLTLKTLALAATLACSAVHADTLKVNNYTGGGAADAFTGFFINFDTFNTVDTQPWQVTNLTTNGSFAAFCMQRTVGLSSAATTTGETYTGSAYTNAAVVNLFNAFYGDALSSLTNSAAFQLALWELVEDDGNVFTGSLNLTGYTDASLNSIASITTLASTMLAGGTAKANYTLTFWDAGKDALGKDISQDLISAAIAPIPEPSTYALLAGGLGVMGFIARRRRQG